MNIKTVLCGSAFLALAVGAFMPGKALATPIIIPPTTLSVLIDHSGGANPSITIGSLTFSDFSYLGTGDMPSAGGVNVDAYVDPITNDIGLKFQGSFLDFPGSSGSDALIDFKVTENDPDKLVTSAALAGNPSVIPMGPGASGVASVTETFLPTNPTPQLTIFASLNNGVPGPTKLTDTGNFATGQSTVFVQKDVLTFNGTNSVPMLSFITQTFHETGGHIPEPSTVVLMGIGIVGLTLRYWRQRKA